MILGTAGHIDHGKTALVRALTGVETDRLPEERRRGITIALGFAPLRLEGLPPIGVVDVPGHEAFVRTMLAGASGIDVALLVVAADEGVKPQTREHLEIVRLLAVPRLVVALTKCDLVDAARAAATDAEVRALLAATPYADAERCAVSSVTGEGLEALRAAITRAAHAVPGRTDADPWRLPVDRVFSVRGTGTVVTGTAWSGRLPRDASVRLLPLGREARVRTIEVHGAAVQEARGGARVALALAGLAREEVPLDAVLVRADEPWESTRVLRADVTLVQDAEPIGPRHRLRFHVGTADVGARCVALGGPVAGGEPRAVRIVLDAPVVLRAGDRFVLRGGARIGDAPPT
ncbi:MAG: selenocysteine-specific translation elongation factor, partial [Gemmatimonadota bacterium]